MLTRLSVDVWNFANKLLSAALVHKQYARKIDNGLPSMCTYNKERLLVFVCGVLLHLQLEQGALQVKPRTFAFLSFRG